MYRFNFREGEASPTIHAMLQHLDELMSRHGYALTIYRSNATGETGNHRQQQTTLAAYRKGSSRPARITHCGWARQFVGVFGATTASRGGAAVAESIAEWAAGCPALPPEQMQKYRRPRATKAEMQRRLVAELRSQP
jgi:hypothetical protein